MTRLSSDDLTRIKALCDAATPGPLLVIDHNEGEDPPRPYWGVINEAFHGTDDDDALYLDLRVMGGCKADAEFYVAAREALPALLKENERLERKPDECLIRMPGGVAKSLEAEIYWEVLMNSDRPLPHLEQFHRELLNRPRP